MYNIVHGCLHDVESTGYCCVSQDERTRDRGGHVVLAVTECARNPGLLWSAMSLVIFDYRRNKNTLINLH